MKKKPGPSAAAQTSSNPTLMQRLARLAELEAAIDDERAAIERQREEDLRGLWQTFVSHVESAGSSIEEVMQLGGYKQRSSKAVKQTRLRAAAKQKIEPMYVNPADPSETWSGRGLRARWLTAALAADPKKSLPDFLAPARQNQKAN